MHAEISGTVDFREPDDESCLARIRALVDKMGHPPAARFDYKETENPLVPARGNLRHLFVGSRRGNTTCTK